MRKFLSREEELDLIRKVQHGTEMEARAAESILVDQFYGFVCMFARKYPMVEYPTVDDLIQEGLIGLLKATKSFDPSMNIRFSTWAKYDVQKAIRRSIANTRHIIRTPENRRSDTILDPLRHTYALDFKLDDSGKTLGDSIADDRETFTRFLDQNHDTELLFRMLNRLTEKQRFVICERFGINVSREGRTCEDIAREMNRTRQNVQQMERTALERIRLFYCGKEI